MHINELLKLGVIKKNTNRHRSPCFWVLSTQSALALRCHMKALMLAFPSPHLKLHIVFNVNNIALNTYRDEKQMYGGRREKFLITKHQSIEVC